MSIYMKYGKIDGAVTTKGFEKWMEVQSLSWSTSRTIDTAARGAATREMSEPKISEVHIMKRWDRASPRLILESIAGTHELDVMIKFTTTQRDSVGTFLTFKLTDCALASYQLSASGDNRSDNAPTESLSVNFTKLYVSYIEHDETGRASFTERIGYDLMRMLKL